jgi:3,4-dihydroxy 2-butanone 4-phosphate synthase/GTP cyclohydrolase II
MKLAEYLEQHQIRRSDFAARIGKSQSYITMICSGEVWPSREAVSRITEVTGGAVTANDFVGLDAEAGGSAPSAA